MRKILVTLLAGALFMVALTAQAAPAPTAPPASSQSADPLSVQLQAQLAQQQQLTATIQSLTTELHAAKDSKQSLQQLILANQASITLTVTQLTAAEQKYSDAISKQAADHAAAIAARNREAGDKKLLAMYVRFRYQSSTSVLSYVLSSTSFSDMVSRAASLEQITQRSTDLVAQIAGEAAAAESAETRAAADAAAAAQATAVLQTQQQTLEQQTATASQLIGQLSVQAAATAREINAANSQTLAVAQQIAQTRLTELDNTIAAAYQAAWQAATYYVQNNLGTLPTGFATPLTTPVTANGTQLAWPAHGVAITQTFGPSAYPFEPPFGGYPHFHTGVDLAGRMGTPITAAADGVVVSADATTQGYGNNIIIASAGGILTLYGHLEAMLVKAGTKVTLGEPIGLMGSTGNSTGPHCHFEVRVGGQPVNPLPFLPALPQGANGP